MRMVCVKKSERRPVAQDLGEAHQENCLTLPVTVAAVDPEAVQAADEQQEAQTHTVELSAA